jgi:hypothetical protein
MNVWLIHPGDIRPLIAKVMPGIHWEKWEGRYLRPKVELKADKIAEAIKRHLSQLNGVTKISINRLKKEMDLGNTTLRTFSRALRKGLIDTLWELKDRSIVHIFEYYDRSEQKGTGMVPLASDQK